MSSLCVALTLFLTIGSRSSFAQQPNIVIINIDDMGWGDFGVYGSEHSQTPNIDALAAAGHAVHAVLFRRTDLLAVAGIAVHRPVRGAVEHQHVHQRLGHEPRDRDNANHLPLDAPSIARTFHDNGYATGHFGKWHLGGGRDVGYAVGTTAGTNATAPRIVEYGYDEAWTQMEGLANRIINVVDYGGNANGVTTAPERSHERAQSAERSPRHWRRTRSARLSWSASSTPLS